MTQGSVTANSARILFGLGQAMAEKIPESRFARLSEGAIGSVPSNHPAWCYGHLALYCPKLLHLLGQPDAAEGLALCENEDELFGRGSECLDDVDGGRYPDRSRILKSYVEGFNRLLEAIEHVDEQRWNAEHPDPAMRERFPTVGAVVQFVSTGHAAFHLGQVSTWRRVEGLGSVDI